MDLRKFIISLITKYSDDGFAKADKEVKALGKSAKKTEKELLKLDKAQTKASKSAEKLAKAEERAKQAADKAAAAARKAGAAGRKSGSDAKKGARDWGKFKEAMTSAKDVAATLAKGITAGAAGIVGVGAAVVSTGVSFESLRARLKTVEGSAKGASKAFAQIQDFTKTTPFELDEVTTAYLRLKSLGLDASTESMTAFGNVAASQGKSVIDFIEAVADASTGEFERLKEFGIKASSQGEQVAFTFAGQTTTVGKNAEEIQAFLRGIGETQFAGAMSDQMMTASGAISNLKDGLKTFLDTVAQMGVLDAFKGLLGDIGVKFGEGKGFAEVLANALIRVIEAIREAVKSIEKEDIAGAFETFYDAAKALATGINLAVKAMDAIIEISGGFEGAMVNMTLATVGLVAAFQGPVGLVVMAAAAGAAIGNLLNAFGATDYLENLISKITGLNAKLAELDRRNSGRTTKRGAPKLRRFDEGGDLIEEDIQQQELIPIQLNDGRTGYATEEQLLDLATGTVQNTLVDPSQALQVFEERDAANRAERRATALEQGRKAAAKAGQKKKGKGKGKKFFDFDKQVKDAARKQAEEFAQRELERLVSQGTDPDEAIALARQAGRQRAKELEERFRQAGKVFDASSKSILDMLGLRGPGSVLENRPPPQTLLITIAPVIKLIESLTITVQGAGSDEERDRLQDAANQARDAIMAKIGDLPDLVAAMFELQGKRLLAAHGGGRTIPGVQ